MTSYTVKVSAFLTSASLLTGLAVFATDVPAQRYPSKRINIIIPFPPGGGTDLVSRLVAQKLQERLGQPVSVDNRPGGGGVISAQAAMRAEPDGHTLYVGSSVQLILLPNLQDVPYDPINSFVPVSLLVRQYNVLSVHPSVPAKSVRQLVALAKRQPGQLNFASGGSGTLMHLTGELFKKEAAIDMVHIPYRGGGPAVIAVLSGEVSIIFSTPASQYVYIKSGRLRGLALTASQRLEALPGVPTFGEAGYPKLDGIQSWNGVFVPAHTPATVVDTLHAEIVQIMKMSQVVKQLEAAGFEPAVSKSPEEFGASIKSELADWGERIVDAGIKKNQFIK